MKRYFFHLRGPKGCSDDLLGCDFESVEVAYLEANRAALEMILEMLNQREDPFGLRFEICDERLGPVLELPFRELAPQLMQPCLLGPHLREQLEMGVARSQKLKQELAEEFEGVRTALHALQRTIEQPIRQARRAV